MKTDRAARIRAALTPSAQPIMLYRDHQPIGRVIDARVSHRVLEIRDLATGLWHVTTAAETIDLPHGVTIIGGRI